MAVMMLFECRIEEDFADSYRHLLAETWPQIVR